MAIRSGRLAAGSAVPPSRELAEELGVSRGLVVDSYSQLTAEGYLTARRGSATRVAVPPPPARPPARRVGGTAAGLHLIAWLPEGADEHATAMRARSRGVGLHELHRHCTTRAPAPPALLLGFAFPGESDLITATRLLAGALCPRRTRVAASPR
jgi:DNA-binding transcriptional MocR family regulator